MQQTEQDLLTNHINAMGPDLGELFHAVSGELTWLHWRWKEFRTLFGEKPSRIDLINDSAPFFFQVVHDSIFESTILGIARLAAPTKSAGKQNLTIRRFCEPVTLITRAELHDEITGLINAAKEASDFAVEWRNRHIAHRDLDLALKRSLQPLPEATREKVETSLSAFRNVLNPIEREYCGSTTGYEFAVSPWGAKSLLTVIRDGLLRQHDREARRNRGERHEDDLNPPQEV